MKKLIALFAMACSTMLSFADGYQPPVATRGPYGPLGNITPLSSNQVGRADITVNTAKVQAAVDNILNSNKNVRVLYIGDSMTGGGGAGEIPDNQSTGVSMMRDLGLSYLSTWPSGDANQPANGGAFEGFSGGFSANWWTGGIYRLCAFTVGLPYTTILTNINVLSIGYFQQPLGGSISIMTNKVIGSVFDSGLRLNGFSATTNMVWTNIPVIQGNYYVDLVNAGGNETDYVYSVSGYNTTNVGIVNLNTSWGGTTISNILAVPTNSLTSFYSMMNPDIVIWHGKDYSENSSSENIYTNNFVKMVTRMGMTNAQWVVVGTYADTSGDGIIQNEINRKMAFNFGYTYVDCYLPSNTFGFYPVGNSLHPDQQTANWGGAKIEEQLGLRSKGYAEANYALLRHPQNGSGLTNIIKGTLVMTNFLLGTTFTNTAGGNMPYWIHVHASARGTPTTTLGARLMMAVWTNSTGNPLYTNSSAGALEGDAIFTTSPNVWETIDDDIPPSGRWQCFEADGNSTLTMTNSFYRVLQ